MSSRRARLSALALVTAAAIAGVFLFVPPVPQWPQYHAFADQRAWLGIPNFLNAASYGLLVLVE